MLEEPKIQHGVRREPSSGKPTDDVSSTAPYQGGFLRGVAAVVANCSGRLSPASVVSAGFPRPPTPPTCASGAFDPKWISPREYPNKATCISVRDARGGWPFRQRVASPVSIQAGLHVRRKHNHKPRVKNQDDVSTSARSFFLRL